MKNIIMFEKIKKKIANSKVYIAKNNYKYFVYPYKGLTPIEPAEINYLSEIIAKKISKEVDLLFTFETDGMLTAFSVASLLNKPLVVARKFHYCLDKPIRLIQRTGYFKRNLFFSLDTYKIKKVAIIDCIYSTGGSISSAIEIFNQLEINIEGIYVIVNKPNYNNAKFLKTIKNKFFAIYDVEIINDSIKVNKSKYFR